MIVQKTSNKKPGTPKSLVKNPKKLNLKKLFENPKRTIIKSDKLNPNYNSTLLFSLYNAF